MVGGESSVRQLLECASPLALSDGGILGERRALHARKGGRRVRFFRERSGEQRVVGLGMVRVELALARSFELFPQAGRGLKPELSNPESPLHLLPFVPDFHHRHGLGLRQYPSDKLSDALPALSHSSKNRSIRNVM